MYIKLIDCDFKIANYKNLNKRITITRLEKSFFRKIYT